MRRPCFMFVVCCFCFVIFGGAVERAALCCDHGAPMYVLSYLLREEIAPARPPSGELRG